MKTTHQLANELLAGPDLPVQVLMEGIPSGNWGKIGEVEVKAVGNLVLLVSDGSDDED